VPHQEVLGVSDFVFEKDAILVRKHFRPGPMSGYENRDAQPILRSYKFFDIRFSD
jgi:hypothetical protein